MSKKDQDLLLEHINNGQNMNNYEMKSIQDICDRNYPGKTPYFIENGLMSLDIRQGNIGSCVVLAALGSLADHGEDILYTHMLKLNGLPKNATRIRLTDLPEKIKFRIGMKVISIYKTLPVKRKHPRDNSDYQLLGAKITPDTYSRSEVETWPALFEKAYAKYLGSYDILTNGMQVKDFLRELLKPKPLKILNIANSSIEEFEYWIRGGCGAAAASAACGEPQPQRFL